MKKERVSKDLHFDGLCYILSERLFFDQKRRFRCESLFFTLLFVHLFYRLFLTFRPRRVEQGDVRLLRVSRRGPSQDSHLVKGLSPAESVSASRIAKKPARGVNASNLLRRGPGQGVNNRVNLSKELSRDAGLVKENCVTAQFQGKGLCQDLIRIGVIGVIITMDDITSPVHIYMYVSIGVVRSVCRAIGRMIHGMADGSG